MPQVVLKSWMPRTYDKLHHTLLKPTHSSSKLLAEYLEMLAKYTTDQKKCVTCPQGKVSMSGATECFDMNGLMQNMRSLSAQQGGIIKAVALSNAKSNEVKQKANGLIAKLS